MQYSIESVWGFSDKYSYFYLYGGIITTRKIVDSIIEINDSLIIAIYDTRIFREGVSIKLTVNISSINELRNLLINKGFTEKLDS